MKRYSVGYYFRLFGITGLFYYLREVLSPRYKVFRYASSYTGNPVFLRNKTTDLSMFKQVWVDREYAFEIDSIPEVIVDAGANIGMASLYFASRFPEAKIIAIECDSENFEALKQNTASLGNVVAINRALWSEAGELSVGGSKDREASFFVGTEVSEERSRVRAVTVDGLMENHQLPRIDILKLDIEGAEKEVLEASEHWIDKVNMIVIEVHDWVKPGCGKALEAVAGSFQHRTTLGENTILSRQAVKVPVG